MDRSIVFPAGLPAAHRAFTHSINFNTSKPNNQSETESAASVESDDSLPDVLVQFAHELSTPLSTVILNLEMVHDSHEVEPADERAWQVVMDTLHRQRMLLDSLLAAGKCERGVYSAECRPLNIDEPIAAVIEEYRLLAGRKRIRLRFAPDPHPTAISGNKTLAQLVLTNLVDNAVKYTPSGGEVTVRTRPGDAGVYVDCTDSGPGIPEEEQEAVFRPYYRSARHAQTKRGAGVGLHIVTKLMEAMGGRVQVRSRAGQGSVFTVWFPAWEKQGA
jgi:signal transduction histidine kinase